jgi:hypothetical protein
MANKETTGLVTVFNNAGKPATLAQHAQRIREALKSGDTARGRIIAHISAIDRGSLWESANTDSVQYKSINAYLVDALDISPTAASLYVSVARAVTTEDGELISAFEGYTASQLQELVPLFKTVVCEDADKGDLLDEAGIEPNMSCKAIRDAVKAYLAGLGDDEDSEDEEESGDGSASEEDTADTLAGYVLEMDGDEDVQDWLAAVPESVRDFVTTVLFKRV